MFILNRYNYLIAFHPETLSGNPVEWQFQQLLEAIKGQKDSFYIFTNSNADTNGRIINHMMASFVEQNPNMSALFSSLGSLKFLSIMQMADAIVGNSSSGIIEAPSLKTATINIGCRQKGRIQAASIINCDSSKSAITKAFEIARSVSFQSKLTVCRKSVRKG